MTSNKQKILVVTNSLEIGGTENHLLQILPLLANENRIVRIICIRGGGSLVQKMQDRGVDVRVNGHGCLAKNRSIARRLSNMFTSALFVARQINRFKPDIIHFFLPESYIVGGLASLFFKSQKRIMSRRSRNYYQKKAFGSKIERVLHKHMHEIVANSECVVNDLINEGVHPDRISLCYNAVDIDYFQAVKSKEEARRKLGIEKSSIAIVCVANLIEYKGHEDLLQALQIAKSELSGILITLLLVGKDGGHQKKLEKLTEELGITTNVRYLGSISDVREVLVASDIGVLASHEEGMSNAILEYMCNSLPVVSTDVGGAAETLGSTGLLVPPRDPNALAAALLKLLNDEELRSLLGKTAFMRVSNKFPLEKAVDKYEALYERTVAIS